MSSSVNQFNQNLQQFNQNSDWKDTSRSQAQWDAWTKQEQALRASGGGAQNCPPNLPYTGRNGQCAAKPDDCPDGMHVEGSDTNGTAHCVQGAAGGGGGGGGGWGGAGWGGKGMGGGLQPFTGLTAAQLYSDPSYTFRLNQGLNALQNSAAAKGTVFSGGTSKDIMQYGQDMASQEYQNAYNRAANTWNMNYQPWALGQNLGYGAWTTEQNAALQKYLQQQQNIYGLLNQPMPSYGS